MPGLSSEQGKSRQIQPTEILNHQQNGGFDSYAKSFFEKLQQAELILFKSLGESQLSISNPKDNNRGLIAKDSSQERITNQISQSYPNQPISRSNDSQNLIVQGRAVNILRKTPAELISTKLSTSIKMPKSAGNIQKNERTAVPYPELLRRVIEDTKKYRENNHIDGAYTKLHQKSKRHQLAMKVDRFNQMLPKSSQQAPKQINDESSIQTSLIASQPSKQFISSENKSVDMIDELDQGQSVVLYKQSNSLPRESHKYPETCELSRSLNFDDTTRMNCSTMLPDHLCDPKGKHESHGNMYLTDIVGVDRVPFIFEEDFEIKLPKVSLQSI